MSKEKNKRIRRKCQLNYFPRSYLYYANRISMYTFGLFIYTYVRTYTFIIDIYMHAY